MKSYPNFFPANFIHLMPIAHSHRASQLICNTNHPTDLQSSETQTSNGSSKSLLSKMLSKPFYGINSQPTQYQRPTQIEINQHICNTSQLTGFQLSEPLTSVGFKTSFHETPSKLLHGTRL